ncbi:MAG: alanine racemase, partial [ANME-2 cluster archaeon]|nr:alanine racemase [ANME-2 cluster archaeon]
AGEILLLNPLPEWMAETAVYHDLSVSVIHPSILDSLEKAAQNLEKKVKIHVAVNIGLNRLGISSSGLMEIVEKISSNPFMRFEGLYGQARDNTSAKQSYEQLCSLYGNLKSTGVVPKHLHFPNSTTFLAHPETAISGVRLGILLYGVLPPEQYAKNTRDVPIIPAMSLHTRVIQMREVPKGSKIGYRAGENTEQDLIIATIPIGYAQGLDRKLASSSSVLIKGQRAPFIGAISMNNAMIDVTDIPGVKIGDIVTIVGKQVDSEININELAVKSGTISAELMVRFGQGIARQYISDEDNSNNIVILPKETQNIQINHIQTEKELPDWITVWELIDFLQEHCRPFEDPVEIIRSSLDFALSTDYEGRGFLLIATADQSIVGVIVAIRNETIGFIPENVLVYVCVHKEYRNNGIGSWLVREAVERCDGDVKLHLVKHNPSLDFYKKRGFSDTHLEMRYLKEDKIYE